MILALHPHPLKGCHPLSNNKMLSISFPRGRHRSTLSLAGARPYHEYIRLLEDWRAVDSLSSDEYAPRERVREACHLFSEVSSVSPMIYSITSSDRHHILILQIDQLMVSPYRHTTRVTLKLIGERSFLFRNPILLSPAFSVILV